MDGLCLVIDNIMELSVESCEEYLKVMPNCFSQKGNGSHGEERMATMTKRQREKAEGRDKFSSLLCNSSYVAVVVVVCYGVQFCLFT